MSFGTILYTILISPLQMFFEFIFGFAERFTGHPGLSIIVLSLVMNFLVLPLYKRADAMQAEERDTEAKLHDGLAHIKKSFSGDERMMIQQTYYRQNHYKPTDAFKGSVSLFLEIPFFIAAYQFLSNLQALQGVSFGPISDLGAADGLLTIGTLSINLLPIIMTIVNMISCIIYTKGFPMKTKIQLYGMAIFFLFFLYDSPAGLLFYWTLNNVFSLVKNIFYKLKDPGRILAWMSCMTGICVMVFAFFFADSAVEDNVILFLIGACLEIPVIRLWFRKGSPAVQKEIKEKPSTKMFILSALLLAVILGALIPSSVISSSPQEFVDLYNFHDPIYYIVSAFALSFGTCLIWFGVFYGLASKKGKVLFEKIMWILCGIAVMDYMFFGTKFGTLSSALVFTAGFKITGIEMLVNIALIIILCIVMAVTFQRYPKFTAGALATGILAISGMSIVNMSKIQTAVSPLKEQSEAIAEQTPNFTLSKTGENVVVFMLDRAMGSYIPYIFNEKPELAEQFDGFTYYANTLSYGWHTNFASAALFGGYEYTPTELNARSSESLLSKQNEALKVLPVLFDQNGYDVTVCDVPYGNYQWITDLSIYDEYPNISAYHTIGKFNDEAANNAVYNKDLRNFFCYSLMKSSPLPLQVFLYDSGTYFQPEDASAYGTQSWNEDGTLSGLDETFMDNYNVLKSLPEMTNITEEEQNNFLMMDNETPHSETQLQEPEYEPSATVDNREYDEENQDRFTVNGRTMNMDDGESYPTYEINVASLQQMGEWFDYMRENGVYDNTRIILVADHGFPLGQFDELKLKDKNETIEDLEAYAPLLMVKDFNSTGFSTSDEFMTNADVPEIATSEVIENAANPFTGKLLTSDAKQGTQYVISSTNAADWDVSRNNGNVFLPNNWFSVHDNIWDVNNWKQEAKLSTSPTE
ncbi:MAG: YidC/Oxa1 family membrane protein insertase [Solobacterium sp.]|jgi:YidC/Oxa1 family membrane protein insertase|nr:YidC/Oxa1 family membrane protein insertase [Solobacterium sp.]MCH4206481.1 YidC/Oxa1 family membrane protein insertase [Solobacterium sp.]MCH4282820.1 YidC/Oxa1 family membrane protein insertase [Solobacterium sp.]